MYITPMNNATHSARIEAALTAIKDGEARNLSARTMNKKYAALFAAQDAAKAAAGGWA